MVRSGVTYSFGMFVVQLHQSFPQLSLAEQSKLVQPAGNRYQSARLLGVMMQ